MILSDEHIKYLIETLPFQVAANKEALKRLRDETHKGHEFINVFTRAIEMHEGILAELHEETHRRRCGEIS